MKFSILVISISFILLSCTSSENKKNIDSLGIAKANGIDNFDKVRSLHFTFNVQKDTVHTARQWKWWPKTNMITFYDNGDSTGFKRYDTSTQRLRALNGQFTNDEYWLLFPFHLKWDNGFTLSKNDTAISPVLKKVLHKYTIKYNDKDGFTPGDMYDLYTDDNNVVQEWTFHKKSSPTPTLSTTWEDYQDFAGLKIAKDHKSADGKLRVYFTDVQVEQ